MKVKEVLNYNRIIKAIIDNANDVNSLVKFKLLGMLKQFEPIVANFETIRDEKIVKYGKTTEDGQIAIISPKKDDFENDEEFEKASKEYEDIIKKFTSEMDEVLDSEIDIEIKKFNYDDIMNAGVPSDYLVAIYALIEE